MSLADPPPAARIPEPETDGLPPLPLPAPRPGVRLLYPWHQRHQKDHRGGKIYLMGGNLNPLAPRDCVEDFIVFLRWKRSIFIFWTWFQTNGNTCSFVHVDGHNKHLSFGQFIDLPHFWKREFSPWTCQSITCGLGERPNALAPQADTCTTANCGPWLTEQGHIREQFIMLLRNTTALVIIMLGFMTFGVWHEWDSGKGGGGGAETTAVESN